MKILHYGEQRFPPDNLVDSAIAVAVRSMHHCYKGNLGVKEGIDTYDPYLDIDQYIHQYMEMQKKVRKALVYRWVVTEGGSQVSFSKYMNAKPDNYESDKDFFQIRGTNWAILFGLVVGYSWVAQHDVNNYSDQTPMMAGRGPVLVHDVIMYGDMSSFIDDMLIYKLQGNHLDRETI